MQINCLLNQVFLKFLALKPLYKVSLILLTLPPKFSQLPDPLATNRDNI